jgi:hypothetical protein
LFVYEILKFVSKITVGSDEINMKELPIKDRLTIVENLPATINNEILDYIQETNNNEEEIPYESEQVLDELKDGENVELTPEQKTGLSIEKELEELYKAGKLELEVAEIKSNAKNAYEAIFENYEDGEENGVVTNKYSLIETSDLIFKLTKN